MHDSFDTARRCIELAAASAPAMLGRAVDQAVAALQHEEQRATTTPLRQELADAWIELNRHRADWTQRFPDLLREGQTARAEGTASAPAPLDVTDRFGGLALVDEDALARKIESARVLQLLAPRLEQPLAELNALMSTALGLDTVHPERNPLRPQVFADALFALMQPASQPSFLRLWGPQLAGPLAGEIATLYAEVLKLLRAADLAEATYRVLPTAPSPTKAPVPANRPAAGTGAPSAAFQGGATHDAMNPDPSGSPQSAAPGLSTTGPLGGAAWADLSGYTLGDELFQNFLFSRTAPSTQALAPAYYAKVEAQLASGVADEHFEPYDAEAVAQSRALSPVERPARPVGTARELDNAAWGRWAAARERALHRTRLKKEARQVGQVMGLEVVRKLVDQVARDPRLLGPVREAIVALEPALLRLALVTPRFFAQEDHAGRRLVERVAERSFRYNDEFSTDFHEFFADVRTTFRSLNEQHVDDVAPFQQALQELEERWSGEDAVEQRGAQVAVDAVHFAEARNAEAAQIAWTLSQRSDLEGAPAVVQDFLFGPWSLVMAHARLTGGKGQVDPGGWTSVIPELLWSVKTEQTLRDPARLFTTVPGMLVRLREGLNLIGQEPAENETFFNALENLHRPVLKLRARKRHASHGPEAARPLDPALLSTERRQPRPAGEPWLTPNEWKAAGFEDSQASAPVPLGPAGDEIRDQAAATIATLRKGSWVDLHVRNRWRRASLTWVNERATLFMFTSHGGQPHSMTRRSLERLVRERLLRTVEAGAVVPRAIDGIARAGSASAPASRSRHSAPVPLAA